jgi:hypothetical protein
LIKIPFLGTCLITRINDSKSTDEAKEFSMIKDFNVGVKNPQKPNIIGKITEMTMNGAIVTSINLDFEIFSSVETKPPTKVIPTNVFSDFIKLGINIK